MFFSCANNGKPVLLIRAQCCWIITPYISKNFFVTLLTHGCKSSLEQARSNALTKGIEVYISANHANMIKKSSVGCEWLYSLESRNMLLVFVYCNMKNARFWKI